jgi:hypothetical protein
LQTQQFVVLISSAKVKINPGYGHDGDDNDDDDDDNNNGTPPCIFIWL